MAPPPTEPSLEFKKFPMAPWLEKFWQPVQSFLAGVSECLKGRLTIADNMAGAVIDVPLQVLASGVVQADAVPLLAGLEPRLVLFGAARDASGQPVVASPKALTLPVYNSSSVEIGHVDVTLPAVPPTFSWAVSQSQGGGLSLKVTGATGLAPGGRYVVTVAVLAG